MPSRTSQALRGDTARRMAEVSSSDSEPESGSAVRKPNDKHVNFVADGKAGAGEVSDSAASECSAPSAPVGPLKLESKYIRTDSELQKEVQQLRRERDLARAGLRQW